MDLIGLNDNMDIVIDYLPIKYILHLAQTCKYFNNYTRLIKIKRRISKRNYHRLRNVVDNWLFFHMKLLHQKKNIISWRKKIKDPEREILLF